MPCSPESEIVDWKPLETKRLSLKRCGLILSLRETKGLRTWVAKSWDTKQKDICRWIIGKKGQGQLIVLPGG
eukprot:11595198-Heterocapsa_arctica.AAC.1